MNQRFFQLKFLIFLINGSSGIAVGMATNIPPHNLSEIIDGLVMLLDDPETHISKLNGNYSWARLSLLVE